MITTLEQAAAFLKRWSGEMPGEPTWSQLTPPGIGEIECTQIKNALPGIPESYLRVARSYVLAGVSLPFAFELSPIGSKGESLPEMLCAGNGPGMGVYNRLVKLGLIHVAGWEADYICCYPDTNPDKAGMVCCISDYSVSDPWLLAPDFESFILLVCNLGEVCKAGQPSQESVRSFREIVRLLVGEFYWCGWEMVCNVELS
jgi:hypothetical protein